MSNKEKQPFKIPDEVCTQNTMHAGMGIKKTDNTIKVRTFEEVRNHLEQLIEFAKQQVDIMHGLNDFQKMQYHLGRLHTAKDLLRIVEGKIKKGAKHD